MVLRVIDALLYDVLGCLIKGTIARSVDPWSGVDDPEVPPLFGQVLGWGDFVGCGGAMIRTGTTECFAYGF